MKNIKKTLIMVVSLALVAALAIGGTVAYLTVDPVEKSNIFTVGDIAIELNEEVDGTTGAAQVEKILDADGNMTGAKYSNVMPGDYLQKEVSVKNTGNNPAYVAVEVTINNAGLINSAIDVVYEGKGYTGAEVQAIYDYIFDGFGINYNPRPADGGVSATGEKNARGVIDGIYGLPEHILKVDFAKTTNVSYDTYMIDTSNWFKTEQENNGKYSGFTPASKGYYTADMSDYQIRYTYYLLLEADEESVLFKGFNVPASFNAAQLAMFENMQIDIKASAIQADNFTDAQSAFTALKREYEDGVNDGDYPEYKFADEWDGTVDTSWYNEEATEFSLDTAEQLAGLAKLVDEGNTFEGKTVKLDGNVDLSTVDTDGNRVSFNPIGYGYNTVFKGTFDGQGNTISNLYQNGWALGLSYGTQGGGLFASVVDATIKNVNIDKAEIVMECVDMGILVGYSYGDCTYENISITNSSIANYQRYTGGVVGEVNGNQTFKNVDVDSNTIVSSLWGDFDASLGGIIGGKYGDATVILEDCDVACVIEAYNDVTSSYQWYAYRRAGMLIGNSEETRNNDGSTVASASYLTAKNCTVTYGDWANYTYCEFAGTSWPYVRVQGNTVGQSSPYSNPRYGVATDANGNKVVNDNHVHNEGEDHFILCVFDQLYGGGQGVYGYPTHDGVTVIYNNK